MFSDDEMYRRYLAGDTACFDALITKYTGRLVLYLAGLTHDIHDAEDLAIESFAAVMLKKPAIRPGGFQAYLYRAARNRATRFHILKRRLPAFSLEETQAAEALAARPEDEYLRDERRQAVLTRYIGNQKVSFDMLAQYVSVVAGVETQVFWDPDQT